MAHIQQKLFQRQLFVTKSKHSDFARINPARFTAHGDTLLQGEKFELFNDNLVTAMSR